MITIAIVDDQQLFLRSLATLINSFEGFKVVIDAVDGVELIDKVTTRGGDVDILLTDVQMPKLDGQSVSTIIQNAFPQIKKVALSVKDDDATVLSMVRAGCCAYFMKDIHPNELRLGLRQIHEQGYYHADLIGMNYRRLLANELEVQALKLSDRELRFLNLACSDLTYKEIAAKMFLSEKTIDGYREALFLKLNVKSRVGMALAAVKKQLVDF